MKYSSSKKNLQHKRDKRSGTEHNYSEQEDENGEMPRQKKSMKKKVMPMF